MIKYHLGCASGHAFDAWFRSISDFEKQAANGHLTCGVCGSEKVDRLPMAPAVVSSKRATSRKKKPTPSPTPSNEVMAPIPQEMADAMAKIRLMKAELLKNSNDVGKSFADEARKIHFGDAEPRTIHGQATDAEAKGLADDGIDFAVLPTLPEDRN